MSSYVISGINRFHDKALVCPAQMDNPMWEAQILDHATDALISFATTVEISAPEPTPLPEAMRSVRSAKSFGKKKQPVEAAPAPASEPFLELRNLRPPLAALIDTEEEAAKNVALEALRCSFLLFSDEEQLLLLDSYHKTEDLIEKVRLSEPTLENIAFIAQVREIHYPALAGLLKKASIASTGNEGAGKVIKYANRQFEIIQKGLTDILGQQMSRVVDAIAAQTETLRREVETNSSLTAS